MAEQASGGYIQSPAVYKNIQWIIGQYKENFHELDDNERYKWEAVYHYKRHWNIDAPDFAQMAAEAFSYAGKPYRSPRTGKPDGGNLLTAHMYYAYDTLKQYSKADPEAVRELFRRLYDEKLPLTERFYTFNNAFEAYAKSAGKKSSSQDMHAVSVYLTFEYPEKYFIYKHDMYDSFRNYVGYAEPAPAKMGKLYEFECYMRMCQLVLSEAKNDAELIDMSRQRLRASCYDEEFGCYQDEQYHLLAMDIIYYGGAYLDWSPNKKQYPLDITKDDWKELLQDREIFDESSLQIMKCMMDIGGQATCTELAQKYGRTPNFYSRVSSALAERIHKKTNCPLTKRKDGRIMYWPVLYMGRQAPSEVNGTYIWKLRKELKDALKETDLSNVRMNGEDTAMNSPAAAQIQRKPRSCWWLNVDPKTWSFSEIKVGEAKNFTLYNINGNKRKVFQNFLDAKAGDIAVGYESTPVKKVVAVCRVKKESDGNEVWFEKIESLSEPIEYDKIKECEDLAQMEFLANPNGTLFKLTEGEYAVIEKMIRQANPISVPRYTDADFINDVYMSREAHAELKELLREKKNIILQGAPGVGKTFAAKRLAYSMMGEKDDSRIELVQFHQSYSYEDFIMGYRPTETGFKLRNGVFYEFCEKARRIDKDCFFIIDEINRGNISKIFGELLMLIEKDSRDKAKIKLPYADEPFSVPSNLYIIGMMNTADRSLALIDYALRRRFSFFDMKPAFDSDGFKKYMADINSEAFNALIDKIKDINREISADKSLGAGCRIGHSYFCGKTAETCTAKWMRSVVKYDIYPLLAEYWFDDEDKAVQLRDELLRVIPND